MYSCLFSTVQLSGASLASVEVSLTLLIKFGTDKQIDKQIHGSVCRVVSATKNAVNSGHYTLPSKAKGSARTLPGPIFDLCLVKQSSNILPCALCVFDEREMHRGCTMHIAHAIRFGFSAVQKYHQISGISFNKL